MVVFTYFLRSFIQSAASGSPFTSAPLNIDATAEALSNTGSTASRVVLFHRLLFAFVVFSSVEELEEALDVKDAGQT